MTASLHALPVPGLHHIPELMRSVADAIEAGDYQHIGEAVLLLAVEGGGVEVFGWGTADATATYYLLGRAQRKMERIDLL